MNDFSHSRSPASASKHKDLYKLGSPVSWKESYKKRCADRLKGSRAKLLQKYRDIKIDETSKVDGTDLDSSVVDDVMREEWNTMQRVQDHFSDFDALVSTMEEIKHELMLQEKEIVAQYKRMQEMDDQALQSVIDNHDESNMERHVVCPICRSSYLEKCRNLIKCKCGMCIDTQQDCITLQYVDIQLRVGTTSHSERCNAKPVFGVIKDFGGNNLLMTCNVCDYMFVVI